MKGLFILVFVFPLNLYAQLSVVDSLNRVVHLATHDTLKVQALKALAWHYYFNNIAEAPHYVRQVIRVSEKSEYIKGIWDGYNIMGMVCYARQDYDSAVYWLKKGFTLSKDRKYYPQQVYGLNYITSSFVKQVNYDSAKMYADWHLKVANDWGNNVRIAKAYKSLALLLYDKGDYLVSIKNFLKADSLMGNEINIDHGEIQENIGHVYHILGNQQLEKKYLLKAADIYKALNDRYGASTIEMSLGNLELANQNYEGARVHFTAALIFFETYNDPEMLASAYRYLGRSLYFLNEPHQALSLYKKALATLRYTAGSLTVVSSYHEMGEVLVALKQYTKAADAFNTGLQKAEKTGGLNSKADILQSIAKMYEQQGDFKKAFETQGLYQRVNDSLNAVKTSKAIVEVEARYQTEKKEREIASLGEKHQRAQQEKREQEILFVIIVLSLMAVAIIFYFLLKTKKKANRRLQELDEMKSRFFTNISHEFRTPLTLISGPVENRLIDPTISADERADLEMINRQSNQLLLLVDQLLDLSKLESGNLRLSIEKGDLVQLLKVLASSFHYLAEQKQIDYQIVMPPANVDVWYDHDAIHKVVTNLLSNAFKYTPDFGVVSVEAKMERERMIMVVSNSGEGVPATDIERIFDRFYQADGRSAGMGIGLALVKELIYLLKGDIKVNTTPGGLTSFTISIPVSKEAFPKAQVITSRPGERSRDVALPGIVKNDHEFSVDEASDLPLLLLVEDHGEVRSFIRKILQHEYRILEAFDGKAGIKLALEHIPDLIISDVMMPDTDGLALCKKLKTHEFTSHIPIILLTAKAGDENALTGFESGADDYITKPFKGSLLKVRIQKLIELRRNLHERYSREIILKPKQIAVSSTDQQFLEKMQNILDIHLTDSDFTVEIFADEIGMSRMQLHRKLKGLTGLSATNFIRSQRLAMAAELLKKSDANISEIGYLVGFNDPSYFSKCFKETFNCTPTEFSSGN